MNPQDNPLQRFKSFWWAVAIFSLFGVAALLFHLAQRDKFDPSSADDQRRTELRNATANEQSKLFEGYTPSEVFPIIGKQLIEQKAQPTQIKQDEAKPTTPAPKS